MSVLRKAPADWPVNELIGGRWSPLSFSGRPVEPEKLAAVFEAARWAPSSFNEQPWGYVMATQREPESFQALGALLVDGNAWARSAFVLSLSVARTVFVRNGKPNPHAWHDVGAASEKMFLQAAELGLGMHQMAGFDRVRAREVLGLDDKHEPVAMIALGYPGDPALLPETLRTRGAAPRKRFPIEDFVHAGIWGSPARFTR